MNFQYEINEAENECSFTILYLPIRGEIPKGKHFAKSNFEKIRVKVFETFLALEGLFCDVLIKLWCQKEA